MAATNIHRQSVRNAGTFYDSHWIWVSHLHSINGNIVCALCSQVKLSPLLNLQHCHEKQTCFMMFFAF